MIKNIRLPDTFSDWQDLGQSNRPSVASVAAMDTRERYFDWRIWERGFDWRDIRLSTASYPFTADQADDMPIKFQRVHFA